MTKRKMLRPSLCNLLNRPRKMINSPTLYLRKTLNPRGNKTLKRKVLKAMPREMLNRHRA